MFAAFHGDAAKAGANLEPFAGGQAEHRLGEVGLEPVEDRFAPANRHAAGHSEEHTAHAVARLAGAIDKANHFLSRRFVRATDDVGFDLFERKFVGVNLGRNFLHLLDAREHFDTELLLQNFLGNRARGHAADGFARAGTAATGPGADTILSVVCVIGMARSVFRLHLRVRLGALVGVFHQ